LFDIGGSLAAARKGQGLTPADAERLTFLRGKYLVALENDDFDALPGRVYARAFLRTYADSLGLDADRFVEEFDGRYPEPDDAPPPAVIRPRRTLRVRPRLVIAVVAVAAFAGAIAWSSLSPPPKLAPAVRLPAAKAARAHARLALAVPPPVVPHHAARAGCWCVAVDPWVQCSSKARSSRGRRCTSRRVSGCGSVHRGTSLCIAARMSSPACLPRRPSTSPLRSTGARRPSE